MFILKTGHQPGVYVPLRALFLVYIIFVAIEQCSTKRCGSDQKHHDLFIGFSFLR